MTTSKGQVTLRQMAKQRGVQLTVISSGFRLWCKAGFVNCRTLVGVRRVLTAMPVIENQLQLEVE